MPDCRKSTSPDCRLGPLVMLGSRPKYHIPLVSMKSVFCEILKSRRLLRVDVLCPIASLTAVVVTVVLPSYDTPAFTFVTVKRGPSLVVTTYSYGSKGVSNLVKGPILFTNTVQPSSTSDSFPVCFKSLVSIICYLVARSNDRMVL